MKFTSLVSALSLALPVFAVPTARGTEPLTYDTLYDNSSYSLDNVACSNGANGLITKGYTTLGSLPNFPNVGGLFAVTGWNSTECGTCWNVTYNDTTISVLAIDTSYGIDLSVQAMNELTNGQAIAIGRVDATAVQVAASYCGL